MWMSKPLTLITATILVVSLLLVPISLAQNSKTSTSAPNPSTVTIVSPIAPPAPAVQKGTPMESGDVIVKFKQGISTASDNVSSINAQVGATVVQTSTVMPGVQLVKLPAGASVDDAIAQYKSNPAVEGAWPNGTWTLAKEPNDPYYGPNDPLYPLQEWGLNNTGQTVQSVKGTLDADIDAPDAWNTTTGNSNVIIAVADTGVQKAHEDLAANVGSGWDFIYNTGDTSPLPWATSWHGTHVAGTIGATTNNSLGIAGVDWKVTIMPLQIFDTTGSASWYNIGQAIAYAGQHGASIINLSLGGTGYSDFVNQTIASSPLLVVCAAGNDGTNDDATPFYPASYDLPNIISVAASDSNDNLASFSNYGATSVDLAAPGVNIFSTYYLYNYGYGYAWASGTSMAAPQVSGVAGLIKAVHSDYTVAQLKSAILSNTDAKSTFAGKTTTGGRLNADKAVLGAWQTWEKVGDSIAPGISIASGTSPAVAASNGQLDLFAIGTDNAIWHRSYVNGAWQTWEKVGDSVASGTSPAVAASNGQLDLFAIGTDNAIYHRSYVNGAWLDWEKVGDSVAPNTSPAISSNNGQLDLFAIGTDNAIYHRSYVNGAWLDWEKVGDSVAPSTSPAVTSNNGQLDLFAIGTDNAIWHRSYVNGAWQTWEKVGDSVAPSTSPAVTSNNGQLDLFAIGTDNAIWHRSYVNGAWQTWEKVGDSVASGTSPAVAASNGQLDLFAVGTDNGIWHRSYA
jgi:subtilisin family serine protease